MGAGGYKMATASNSRVLRTIPLTLIVALFFQFAYSKMIHVDDDGQADFDNIQAGIDAADIGVAPQRLQVQGDLQCL